MLCAMHAELPVSPLLLPPDRPRRIRGTLVHRLLSSPLEPLSTYHCPLALRLVQASDFLPGNLLAFTDFPCRGVTKHGTV